MRGLFIWFILRVELRLSHFPEIFDFFTDFLNSIMHIGGPLSFPLVSPPTLVGIGTLEFTLVRACVRACVRPENSQ